MTYMQTKDETVSTSTLSRRVAEAAGLLISPLFPCSRANSSIFSLAVVARMTMQTNALKSIFPYNLHG